MLNFLCAFKACAKFIWPHQYFSNPSPFFSLFLPLSFFCLDYSSNSFLTGTMPLFFPSPNLFFHTLPNTKLFILFPLLKIPQWFPVAHKMKIRLPIMAHPSSGFCLHFQHHFLLLSLPWSTFWQYWTIYGYWNLMGSLQAFAFGIFLLLGIHFSPALPLGILP